MREIDTNQHDLICAGEDISAHWPLKSRESVKMLEKKEVFCSWWQVKNGGIDTQIPSLRVGSRYFSMPLRVRPINPTPRTLNHISYTNPRVH
jgi:hypothetical protein